MSCPANPTTTPQETGYDARGGRNIMRKIIRAAAAAALLATLHASPAQAETRYRTYGSPQSGGTMQSGEVLVCYGPSGAGTYAISRKSPKHGPDKWTTYTHCEQNAWGYRNGRWVDWHDRQTGDVLVCYGGVRIRPIEGARQGAQWAKCSAQNLGEIR